MAIAASSRPPQVFPAIAGRRGAGAIPLGGVMAGSTVVAVIDVSTLANVSESFEQSVTTAGQIKQLVPDDLSGREFWFIVVHS
jgi:hypothetical protein